MINKYNDEKVQRVVNGLNPVGGIDDVFIKYANDELAAVAQFSQVNSQFYQGIPGITNVSGEVVFAQEKLNMLGLYIHFSKSGARTVNRTWNPIPKSQLS